MLLSWSSGKDSAWALHTLRGDGTDVVGLLTTLNEDAGRVSLQGVRRELLDAQADTVGLPVWEVPLPSPCSNDEYERRMSATMSRAVDEGITHIAFGDLFLEDVREYRVEKMAATGIEPLFPKPRPDGPGWPRKVPYREIVDAILYLLRTGCAWRLLPHGAKRGSVAAMTRAKRWPAAGVICWWTRWAGWWRSSHGW